MIDYTPLTGSECPVNLNALLQLFAAHLNLPATSVNVIISETAPAPSALVLWFRPTTNTLSAYSGGAWHGIDGGFWHVGDIIMFDVVIATDLTLASSTNPNRRPWAVCDGGTYGGIATPDMTNRFVRGALSGFGGQGGAAQKTLDLTNIPAHTHGIPYARNVGSGAINCGVDVDATGGLVLPSIPAGGTAGATVAFDLLGPYTTLGFKKYIGTP
ncbi:MAG: hypothetical protein ABI162_07095 [Luteolibacter sp.]